jgi:UDP-3-O-[3-hydroxymyristoyl] N-acetylglucosamine deacetylase
MKFSRQTTLRSQATVTGVGVHSGLPVSLTLGPAPVDAGFIFVRTGADGRDREVQASAESVISTEFATVLATVKARLSPPPSMCSQPCAAWASITP